LSILYLIDAYTLDGQHKEPQQQQQRQQRREQPECPPAATPYYLYGFIPYSFTPAIILLGILYLIDAYTSDG
jgi:hypothetical protein